MRKDSDFVRSQGGPKKTLSGLENKEEAENAFETGMGEEDEGAAGQVRWGAGEGRGACTGVRNAGHTEQKES